MIGSMIGIGFLAGQLQFAATWPLALTLFTVGYLLKGRRYRGPEAVWAAFCMRLSEQLWGEVH